jgi:hypothetical protein
MPRTKHISVEDVCISSRRNDRLRAGRCGLIPCKDNKCFLLDSIQTESGPIQPPVKRIPEDLPSDNRVKSFKLVVDMLLILKLWTGNHEISDFCHDSTPFLYSVFLISAVRSSTRALHFSLFDCILSSFCNISQHSYMLHPTNTSLFDDFSNVLWKV